MKSRFRGGRSQRRKSWGQLQHLGGPNVRPVSRICATSALFSHHAVQLCTVFLKTYIYPNLFFWTTTKGREDITWISGLNGRPMGAPLASLLFLNRIINS